MQGEDGYKRETRALQISIEEYLNSQAAHSAIEGCLKQEFSKQHWFEFY